MAEKVKHTVKDSVFAGVFGDVEAALEIYRRFHPEDTTVTAADCESFELKTVLVESIYNDFGILVRDRLILLLEAQSTFTKNITLRMLLYLAETYDKYVKKHRLNLYSTADVKIPCPELYMVYVGPPRDVPDTIRLSALYQETDVELAEHGGVDLVIKVIRKSGRGDLLDQYIRFCEIVDEKRKQYGNNIEAVKAIIRQCLKESVLTEYLTSRREEAQTMMMSLFDQETIMANHDYEVEQRGEQRGIEQGMKQGIEQGIKQGIKQGVMQGVEQGIRAMVEAMQSLSQTRDVVVQMVAEKFDLQAQTAAEKVAQYWA